MTESNASRIRRMRDVPLFQGVDDTALSALVAHMRPRAVHAGETLIREGDPGDEMFFLLEGRVRISKMTLDHDRYTVAELDGARTPFIGELALLDQDRRSATIDVVADGEVLVLGREDFEHFGDEHPHAGLVIVRELARMVSANLRHANEDALLLFEALVGEVRSKVAG